MLRPTRCCPPPQWPLQPPAAPAPQYAISPYPLAGAADGGRRRFEGGRPRPLEGLFLVAQLQIVDLPVEPVLLEQLLVAPALDDAAFLQHQDLVGRLHRPQAL